MRKQKKRVSVKRKVFAKFSTQLSVKRKVKRGVPKRVFVKQKRIGRPPTGVDPVVGVRLDSELLGLLDGWAAERNMDRSKAIRVLLNRILNPPPATVSKAQLSSGFLTTSSWAR